ncbi:hypothetical protein [Streptomyces sp. CAI-85]|uniref:hypothetical protein n=1 Tax=Streptomyces sp. CAI-85 TaxID=1472662 RepID=UPI001587C675|nr:hypothetical protein [Streptomyces sp. CAI-85]NUV59462.1 hypothetical protein [Streptomyces sp. CAI-85]
MTSPEAGSLRAGAVRRPPGTGPRPVVAVVAVGGTLGTPTGSRRPPGLGTASAGVAIGQAVRP